MKTPLLTALLTLLSSTAFASSAPSTCGTIQFNLNNQGGTVSAPIQDRYFNGTCTAVSRVMGVESNDYTCSIYVDGVSGTFEISLTESRDGRWTAEAVLAGPTGRESRAQRFSCN